MADPSELARNAIESEFRTSKMADRSEMARNAIKSDFRTSKMADGGHLKKKHLQNSYASDLNNVRTDCTTNRQQLDINSLLINIYTDRYVGNKEIYIMFAL